MFIRQRLHRVSVAIVAMVLLAACGDAPGPTTSAPAEGESPAAANSIAETPTAVAERADANASGDGAAPTSESGVAPSGAYVSDLGFRPETHGFAFPNYGGEGETNLTPNDARRMFGDQVCAQIDGDTCLLTPPATQWLEQINSSMNGGHCEGMAVLSNLFYTGQLKPSAFGADTVPSLTLAGNELLQREIAYWFTTQATQPARAAIIEQTPSGVLNTLITSLAAGPSGGQQFAVGFYKRDRTGGHAVTPFAVEDRGNGLYAIMIYDNNYPGIARAIEVNTTTDTWQYSGSTNPNEPSDDYEGDADTKTLELAPIAPRLSAQQCPFCAAPATGYLGGRLFAPAHQGSQQFNQVWLEGSADLLITDAQGRSVGFKNGAFVSEIPGAQSNANKFGVNVWNINAEPVYYIPSSIDFSISIDGNRLQEAATSTVTMIGPGYVLEVSDIILEPGQVDTLDVAPDGSLLSYRTETGETPLILVAIETKASDYLFGVYGEEMAAGEALNLSLDTEKGWLSIDAIDNASAGSYSLQVARYDDQGEQVFGAQGVTLAAEDVLYVDYLKWPGNGQPMTLGLDKGGDGSVDESIEVADVTDTLEQ